MRKVYVWEGVLCDYTCGMVVVVAESLEEAHDCLRRQFAEWAVMEIMTEEPQVIDPAVSGAPDLFYVSGGG
jgi:hypothetical protein